MGFINDLIAVKNVEKIKKGKKARLSVSQITGLSINLIDANKNLSPEEFNKVYEKFKEYRTYKDKCKMDMEEYVNTVRDIITVFDEIAPYEKYSGANENEVRFLMEQVRPNNNDDVNLIIEGSNGIINEETANRFLKVLYNNPDLNKQNILKDFDIFAKELIAVDPAAAIFQISFFLGMLNGNNIITKEELDIESNKYQKIVTDIMMNQPDDNK